MIVVPADPTVVGLTAALRRFLATTGAPKYLREAATPWLAKQAARLDPQ